MNIEREKYDLVNQTILNTIRSRGQLSFNELMEGVNQQLEGRFDGSISWYTTCVKLDLEARGEIERVPNSKPQRLQITALRLPKSGTRKKTVILSEAKDLSCPGKEILRFAQDDKSK